METLLQSDTIIQRIDDRFMTNPVGEECVLLNLDTGDYLGLNGVGAFIWRLLKTPIRFSELENQLMSVYETDIITCREETRAFLNRIAALGLLSYKIHQD